MTNLCHPRVTNKGEVAEVPRMDRANRADRGRVDWIKANRLSTTAEDLAVEDLSLVLDNLILEDPGTILEDLVAGAMGGKVDRKKVDGLDIASKDSVIGTGRKEVDGPVIVYKNLATEISAAEDLVIEDLGIILEELVSENLDIAPEDPDIVLKDIRIASEDLAVETPAAVEDSNIKIDQRRVMIERQRLARRVASLFSFQNVLNLLFSFSQSDTIAIP